MHVFWLPCPVMAYAHKNGIQMQAWGPMAKAQDFAPCKKEFPFSQNRLNRKELTRMQIYLTLNSMKMKWDDWMNWINWKKNISMASIDGQMGGFEKNQGVCRRKGGESEMIRQFLLFYWLASFFIFNRNYCKGPSKWNGDCKFHETSPNCLTKKFQSENLRP